MIKECKNCKNTFDSESDRRKYCSRSCFYDSVSDKVQATCKTCRKKFKVQRSQYKKRKFCSQECYHSPRRIDYDCPKRKMYNNISKQIWLSIKENKKGNKWESLVGYTIDDLRQSLEKKFKDGMSWDNYGDWHIDHIIPKSAFNFTDYNQIGFRECWSLDNLQPLWAKDNYSKSNKIIKPFQKSLPI